MCFLGFLVLLLSLVQTSFHVLFFPLCHFFYYKFYTDVLKSIESKSVGEIETKPRTSFKIFSFLKLFFRIKIFPTFTS